MAEFKFKPTPTRKQATPLCAVKGCDEVSTDTSFVPEIIRTADTLVVQFVRFRLCWKHVEHGPRLGRSLELDAHRAWVEH